MSQVIAHLENRTCTARGWLDDYKPLFKAIQQRIVEEKGSPPECAVCNRDFANVAAFKQHLKDKHNPSYCFSCRKKFKSVNDREYHNVHLAAANKGQFHCVDCRPATTFGTEKEYDDHKREAHAACGPCGLTFKDVGSLLEHDYTVHFTCRQCSRRHASLEEYGLHCNSHRTPLEAVNAATGLLINMSKGEISRSQATAIINEVILKTGGTIPVIEAETEVIPTAVQEQVTTAAPLINAPAPVKAEAKVTPATRTTNTPAETQPGPTTTPAVEPPAQNKRRKKKQPPQKLHVRSLQCGTSQGLVQQFQTALLV
ncbi:hypothetical protein NW766_007065 [Fusarium irregulare]|uniref:C2H2-type domain-containing protein n=1 Tax=Fusarium irregulare TaxID=2494466 RepID=A0A9W8U7Q4_9HYPO|nr:hypothetical protein NW766_007065 [Fusarium irregulare]